MRDGGTMEGESEKGRERRARGREGGEERGRELGMEGKGKN